VYGIFPVASSFKRQRPRSGWRDSIYGVSPRFLFLGMSLSSFSGCVSFLYSSLDCRLHFFVPSLLQPLPFDFFRIFSSLRIFIYYACSFFRALCAGLKSDLCARCAKVVGRIMCAWAWVSSRPIRVFHFCLQGHVQRACGEAGFTLARACQVTLTRAPNYKVCNAGCGHRNQLSPGWPTGLPKERGAAVMREP